MLELHHIHPNSARRTNPHRYLASKSGTYNLYICCCLWLSIFPLDICYHIFIYIYVYMLELNRIHPDLARRTHPRHYLASKSGTYSIYLYIYSYISIYLSGYLPATFFVFRRWCYTMYITILFDGPIHATILLNQVHILPLYIYIYKYIYIYIYISVSPFICLLFIYLFCIFCVFYASIKPYPSRSCLRILPLYRPATQPGA